MKAVVYEKYGPPEVLHLTEIPKPVPKDNEVLIKVYATTVTIGDIRMRAFIVPRGMWLPARLYLGVFKPKRAILGMELAGVIEAVGSQVTQYKPGDSVFASTSDANFGGYAEYKCISASGLIALKPENLTYEEAAAAFGGGVTAMRCLRKGKIQPGQRVLIYGASGAVGTNAVQLVKNVYGAHVTGVCSTANLALVRSLGADQVIDYTKEDFAQSDQRYDVIFDAVSKYPPARAKQALKPGGVYLNVHRDSNGDKNRDMRQDLLDLKALIEDGKIKPVIDRCYRLDQIVEAHRYVDQGHKKGNVAVTVAQTPSQREFAGR